MDRWTFLNVAAALTTLPTVEAAGPTGGAPDTEVCDLCESELPAGMIEQTTVQTIAPQEADICPTCKHVQNYDPGDEQCMQCGNDVSPGFSFEVEFPLGAAALTGGLEGHLCGGCARGIASDIQYNAIDADDDAHDRLIELLDEAKDRMSDLEGDR